MSARSISWIGFYEVLGRIADHHAVNPWWGDEEPRPYQYAEQLVWRDLDPTVLVRKPATPATERPWFSPVKARFPHGTADDYPADMAGVPDPLDLIAVSDADDTPWLVLLSNPRWRQPLAPEIAALQGPRLDVRMQLHAYLAPLREAATLRAWATGKDWYEQWMPEIAEPHNVLLGTHPDDPEWSAADGAVEWSDMRAGGPQPSDIWQCAAWYGGTGTSRDASADEESSGYVPGRRLVEALGLSRGVDFAWSDASGVAVHDPSVVLGGPGTLAMRRGLVSRLADAELTIFWTVLIGNELHRSDHRPPNDDYRWVGASASYILDDGRVEQVGALAARYRPGPTTERELEWVTKKGED